MAGDKLVCISTKPHILYNLKISINKISHELKLENLHAGACKILISAPRQYISSLTVDWDVEVIFLICIAPSIILLIHRGAQPEIVTWEEGPQMRAMKYISLWSFTRC